ncbi:MAG: 4Fe-4S ferredoxin iron-sulfur binding domain protein [Methanocalculus sp. 52_23]|nr:MAG: 4Fe-4S ferredoxin iron-sulfur binding domain protein [Methanocalculus sp. 52_23]
MKDEKAVVDEDTCVDCETCVDECPAEAIHME